jgi:exodeoxyribonuclease VII large subunit
VKRVRADFATNNHRVYSRKETYNQTIEELQHSKAKLVETVTVQLKANYEKQIENLNEKIKGLEELKKQSTGDLEKVYSEKINLLQQQITIGKKNYQRQLEESRRLQGEKIAVLNEQLSSYQSQLALFKNKTTFGWAAIILAIIIGLIVGFLIKSH